MRMCSHALNERCYDQILLPDFRSMKYFFLSIVSLHYTYLFMQTEILLPVIFTILFANNVAP